MNGTRIFCIELDRQEMPPEIIHGKAKSILKLLTDEETTKLAEAALVLAIEAARIPLSHIGVIGKNICEHANIMLWPSWATENINQKHQDQ